MWCAAQSSRRERSRSLRAARAARERPSVACFFANRCCTAACARARPTLAGSLWPRRLRLSGRTLFRTRASAPAVLTRPVCRPQYMAKLAEQAERYEEMVEYMKKVAQGKQEEMLSLEVRRFDR